MSIATRSRRLNETFLPPTHPPVLAAPAARGEAEAPERAVRQPEAPESPRGRHSEARDAGEGRASYLEHEFTHGRSQS